MTAGERAERRQAAALLTIGLPAARGLPPPIALLLAGLLLAGLRRIGILRIGLRPAGLLRTSRLRTAGQRTGSRQVGRPAGTRGAVAAVMAVASAQMMIR